MNANLHPESTDAVIGGQVPPPTTSVILGGMAGLHQRFASGNSNQRVEVLADALNYGRAGVDFLLDALEDAVLDVRVAAYQYLQQVVSERTRQKTAEGVPQWWQQFESTLIPERVQRTIAKGIPLKQGDRLYRVYISAIDYDDNYYTLLDSVQAYEAHDFCYDGELIHPVERYLFREQAEHVAQDLHRTILSNGNFAEFNQRHQLKLKPSDYFLFKMAEDLCNFYRNYSQPILNWCTAHGIDVDLSDYLNEEIPDDDDQGEYWWEAQEAVLQQLQSQGNYPLLEEFCNLIGMGRFTFVHEEIVDRDGYFPVTGTLTSRA
ncbi:hypothetical protein K9N68_33355 [Kovacikia minuta CCNUW1]|uniref:hypothetical protein n=1 Tax=Kovacikia minuta TaxID=2931930 RepID=UPI001CC993A8|nr:hypothetical protein [Kovacikia minuta]UBF26333.1 hypothetical protein K9N68_33355 [Kovacikia minuta CCNUW1]